MLLMARPRNSEATQGVLCIYDSCPDFGTSKSNIILHGRTKKGDQRYRCLSCNKTFVAKAGTFAHRRKAPKKDVLEALGMIADGAKPGRVARELGYAPQTIKNWVRQFGASDPYFAEWAQLLSLDAQRQLGISAIEIMGTVVDSALESEISDDLRLLEELEAELDLIQ
ncbi:MAG: hypothetical protein WD273_11665 [Trueperaceae bacterium]